MVKSAAKYLVQGTVQGVFFRQFVKENADKLQLKGYVRNSESGDVEVLAEGEKENLANFKAELKKGPPHSQIRNVSVEDKNFSGDFKEFKVIRF